MLVFFLIIAGIFLFFEESGRDTGKKDPDPVKPPEKIIPAQKEPAANKLPKVAIVMDDLGPNRKRAEMVLELNAPLTLSILPHETYSKWIAKQGHRLGHDIIAHIPMEAVTPQNLGKGALTTGMSSKDIAVTLAGDIGSIPHISGINNHMGSAFTKDEQAMRAVIIELKKHRLFFLDSLTTGKSVAYKLAKAGGLAALRRDVFLDNDDDLQKIEVQWKRLLKIARKKGYAIALAHPRKNTVEFLRNALKNNKEVTIVPITELISENNK